MILEMGIIIALIAYVIIHVAFRMHDKAVRRKFDTACGNPFIARKLSERSTNIDR